jgi:hypothetical protein
VLHTHLQGFHPQKGFSNFLGSTTYQEKLFYARPQQKETWQQNFKELKTKIRQKTKIIPRKSDNAKK